MVMLGGKTAIIAGIVLLVVGILALQTPTGKSVISSLKGVGS